MICDFCKQQRHVTLIHLIAYTKPLVGICAACIRELSGADSEPVPHGGPTWPELEYDDKGWHQKAQGETVRFRLDTDDLIEYQNRGVKIQELEALVKTLRSMNDGLSRRITEMQMRGVIAYPENIPEYRQLLEENNRLKVKLYDIEHGYG